MSHGAEALEKARDWEGLLAHSRRWTQAEPSTSVAWYKLDCAYRKLDRFPEAIEAYREALRLDPDYAPAWNDFGLEGAGV